ncbi:hypothetical protein MA16_Dca026507 [Dendrobium catenatum]|uniref:Uncharacterized protein n=1 Tax=Dendrobium catenatum TaxID=906689 RepID=A0A2I0WVU8_9ASPA|nr:hypothetical protein MA16_Dca026507 [Dendrobium catenatum]
MVEEYWLQMWWGIVYKPLDDSLPPIPFPLLLVELSLKWLQFAVLLVHSLFCTEFDQLEHSKARSVAWQISLALLAFGSSQIDRKQEGKGQPTPM